MESQFDKFTAALLLHNPDFQTDPKKNYERDKPGTANSAICAALITERFQCFAATLEQPFCDTVSEFPQPSTGWSNVRSKYLGESLVNGFASLLM